MKSSSSLGAVNEAERNLPPAALDANIRVKVWEIVKQSAKVK